MSERNGERVIREGVIVDGSLDEVWDAWTTPDGVKSFFGRACNIELRVGGPYEIFFDPDAKPGCRGAEGTSVMAFQPKKMLAFTWTAPPHLPNVRKHLTHVVVRFDEVGDEHTRVTLTHDGWGVGNEWDQAFDYFTSAWRDIVLPRLKRRFALGPIDWGVLARED